MKIITEAFNNELATVIDHGLSNASTGNPQVWVVFKFLEIAAANDEDLGITGFFSLTDASFPYTMEKLTNCGWQGKNLTGLDRTIEGFDDLAGNVVRISGALDTYNGRTSVKVTFVNDKDSVGGVKNPMKRDEIKALDAKLKGKIAAYRSKNPATMKPSDGLPKDKNGKTIEMESATK